MTDDITANDIVAFLVEIGALALLCAWGFRTGAGLAARLLLGLGLPLVAAVAWGLFAAPKSAFDVLAAELAVKVLVLGGGAVAGFTILPVGWAVAFLVVAAANTVLLYVGPFAR